MTNSRSFNVMDSGSARGVSADTGEFGPRQETAQVPKNCFERPLVAKVIRPKVAEKADLAFLWHRFGRRFFVQTVLREALRSFQRRPRSSADLCQRIRLQSFAYRAGNRRNSPGGVIFRRRCGTQ